MANIIKDTDPRVFAVLAGLPRKYTKRTGFMIESNGDDNILAWVRGDRYVGFVFTPQGGLGLHHRYPSKPNLVRGICIEVNSSVDLIAVATEWLDIFWEKKGLEKRIRESDKEIKY